MVALTISHNFPDVQRQLDALHHDIASKATVRAVNRTIEAAKTDMGREIRQAYNVSAAYVRERLRVRHASFRAAKLVIEAALSGGDPKRRSANVIAFLAGKTRKRKGVTQQLRFRIKRKGGKEIIRGAFVGNKGRTVFVRTGKERLPIVPVQTIDVGQMFNARRINDAVVRAMVDKFPGIWAREVRFYTERFGTR